MIHLGTIPGNASQVLNELLIESECNICRFQSLTTSDNFDNESNNILTTGRKKVS